MKPRLLLLLFALVGVTTLAANADQIVEEIIARVNDAIITRSDLAHEKEQLMQNEQQDNADAARIADDQKNLLRDLIDQRLLLDKANELGVDVNNEVVRQLDDMRKRMGLATMEDLEKAAAQQGIDWTEYKQSVKEKLLTQAIIEHEVGAKVSITPEEKKAFYDSHQKELTREEQVRLSEILIAPDPEALHQAEQQAAQAAQAKNGDQQQVQPPPPPEPTPEQLTAAEKKAQDVEAELKKGAKFDEVAKKVSNGPTAQQGGDLGYFKRGVLAKELEDKTFAMKPGDISEPVLTKQGYVILKVVEHVKGGVPPMKDVDPQITDAIYTKKVQPVLREYLTKLREEAYIDIKPGYIDTGASPNQTRPIIATGPATKGGSDKPGKKKKFGIF